MRVILFLSLFFLLKLTFGVELSDEIEVCTPINADYTLFTLCPFAEVPYFYEGNRYGIANFSIQDQNIYKCDNSTEKSWGTFYDIDAKQCVDVAAETPTYRLQSKITEK